MVTFQENQIDSICNDTHLIFAFTPTVKILNPKSLIINNPQTLLNTRLHPQTLLIPNPILPSQDHQHHSQPNSSIFKDEKDKKGFNSTL